MDSIRRRLIIGLLAGLAVLLGSGGATVYFVTRRGLAAEFDSAMLARANELAALVKQDEGKLEFSFNDQHLAEFARWRDKQHFDIRDADGRLLRTSWETRTGEQPPRRTLLETASFWDTTIAGHPARSVGFLFSPPQEENDEDGRKTSTPPRILSLVLTQDRSALDHTLAQLFAVLASVGGVTLAGTALLVTASVKSGLRPLDEIGRQATRIDASSLDTRFAVEAVPRELRSICGCLNDLLSRLDASFQREQRFSADVAHELRTPVAELQDAGGGRVEMAAGRGGNAEGISGRARYCTENGRHRQRSARAGPL